MLKTSIQIAPFVYQIENTPVWFGLDLKSGFFWIADYKKREIISGDFESLQDAEGAAYEYAFYYAEEALLDA